MVFRYSYEKLEINKDYSDSELELMVAVQGCVLSQSSSSFDQSCGFFQKNWYLLVCFLLAKHGSWLNNIRKSNFDEDICISSLEHIVPKRSKPTVKTRSGGDYDGQASSDCLLPGLHDDMALDCLAWACRSDYSSLACLNKQFNLLINSGYLYKLRRQLGIVEHWIYLACSLMPWEAFDPVRQRWMRLPRMPCDECFSCADKESLAVGTQLLVFGRELSGFAIWMYNLVNRSWSRCPLMNLPRCLFGSSSQAEIAIVAGGSDKNGHVLKSAELYNSELGRWEALPDMNLPRKMCSGFFMDGKFYVIGGMSSHTDSLKCGEEYNLETRTWRRIRNMYPHGNRATQSPPLVAVVNNQLYAADQSTNQVKKYDKVNNAWNVVRTLPVRADNYNGWGLAFKACGDKLLVVGGHRGPEGEVIVLHFWCPEDGLAGEVDWDVLSVKERAGAFVYNCAVMGC
ncbi:F-box/kelch-repeat protein At5g60570-like [Aristolochia californica]|uniref:F-box/kelch-repeat protein At5g60570-like n=1 Tax=Aristolochia californica TaxID=171875 RepID=UPI0035DBE012